MNDLARYQSIKGSFSKCLNYLDKKLIFNEKIVSIIDKSIPNFVNNKLDKITDKMSSFYNEVKFPNYDDLENYSSLYDKGIKNAFTKRIDEELDYGIKVLELGCGTGQLSLFLGRANRQIFAVDISEGSLVIGENFRKDHDINNVFFMKMDVFDLKFNKNEFDFTISNGVLHHTKDARKAFKELVEVTKPGGLIVIGLYHKYGRFFTKVKQKIAKVLGSKIFLLDKLSLKIKSKEKRNAWVTDQFLNPHETLHLPSEVINWFKADGVEFINLIPHYDNFDKPIFEKRKNPSFSFLKEFIMIFDRNQIQEGGFFVMIGRKK